jgi:putative zinc finger protein
VTFATDAAAGTCLEPEDIAAFVDGRLQGAARAAVLRHLADCERCHELFAETSRSVLDEEPASRRPRRAWFPPLLAAAGLLLAAAVGILLLRGPSEIQVASLVDALPPSAATHLATAPVLRGGGTASEGSGAAVGALLVDLRLVAEAADPAQGREVLRQLAERLDAAGQMDEETRLVRAAANDVSGWRRLSALIEERAGERFPSPEPELGKLLEAGRLAAASGTPGFFTSHRRAALERIRRQVTASERRAALDAVASAWDAPDRSLPRLERALASALALVSRSPAAPFPQGTQ